MSWAVVAPMVVALLAAVVTLLFGRAPRLQRATSLVGILAYVAVVGVLIRAVVFAAEPGPITYQVGGWPAPVGITLVADALSTFVLAIAATVAAFSLAFAVRSIDRSVQQVYYHPLFHVLVLGVTGAVLTGDLFNLFVWFEVMLIASYVFVAFYGDDRHTAGAMRFVVLNIIGGILMLLAIGGLYATIGTLNMADMAQQLATSDDIETAPVVGLSAFVFATFSLKAGLVPFQFWVPAAYRTAPLPVVAMFAGATKKVGMYAIIRLYFTVFGEARVATPIAGTDAVSLLALLAPALLLMGALSIAVGGFGAIGAESLEGLLAYSSIGQVGFIAVPVAIAAATTSDAVRHLGVLAGLIYALHHALTKGLLFLSTGAIQDATGTTTLARLGGLSQRSPVFASTFFVASLSLVGIPPLAGFFGKLFVFDAAASQLVEAPTLEAGLVVLVLLLGAVLTLVYTTRAWVGSFWGHQSDPVAVGTLDRSQVAILATLAGLVVLVGVGFEPVYQFADAAAAAAIDTQGYVDAVDPGGAPA